MLFYYQKIYWWISLEINNNLTPEEREFIINLSLTSLKCYQE